MLTNLQKQDVRDSFPLETLLVSINGKKLYAVTWLGVDGCAKTTFKFVNQNGVYQFYNLNQAMNAFNF